MKTLRDKVIVITGAGGAIAGAVAEAFFEAGARLALIDRDEVRIQGRSSSYTSLPVISDLSSVAEAERALGEVQAQLGRVDGLVHLVGDLKAGALSSLSEDDYQKVFDGNVRTLFVATKAALPLLRANEEGFIGGIASREAWEGGSGGAPSSALFAGAKSAVAAFLRSLDAELHGSGVDVGICFPMGPVDTASNRRALGRRRDAPVIDPAAIGRAFVAAALSGQGGRLLELPVYPPR